MAKGRSFNVVIEQDVKGMYVASAPDLPGCHTQAKSLDTLMKRIREVIELCLEDQQDHSGSASFIGVQRIQV
jgi:predicted RNase H-like HicB family nuclease